MHDDVDAEVEGILAYRRCKRVVTNDQSTRLMRHRAHQRKIGNAQERICRCLNPHQPRARSEGRLDGRGVAEVSKVDGNATFARMLAQLFERAVVSLKRCDHVIGVTQELEHRHVRSQPRRKGGGAYATFERCHARLEGHPIWRSLPTVAVTSRIRAVRVALECCREINGLRDRSGCRIG